ncbi:CRISP-associated protein Cas1 [Persephonella hydrogeniphila]|uniref:CRISPR-associated endonuclease Cas1 n=1 Tax=Persephonella hydrogeniphila TaxID=198703 RepID=A0A285NJL1_9AQUI|nr:CRISPR-associated endonuclease Cas1 [Persephonella hydrogeniphila]SNZ09113.1 CRISP-associated protein Cas1 [Persephonella hydrogeniphila]
MKEIVFITKQGVKLKRKDNQIVAVYERNKISSFPVNRIDKLFLFGNVEITTSAVSFLLSKNVDIFLLSYSGRLKGVITSPLRSNYTLRLKQYEAFTSPRNIEIAKFFVFQKIKEIEKFIGKQFTELRNKLLGTKDYSEILGIEGRASALFFEKFKEFLDNKNLQFEKREYNPPPDPVNALLSLSYSIFYSLLFSITLSKGYDPYISFLHRKRGTHGAFASDIMEIFRVDLTKFVGVLFNTGIITGEDFENDSEYLLKNNSLKKFIRIYHENVIQNETYLKKINQVFQQLEKIL